MSKELYTALYPNRLRLSKEACIVKRAQCGDCYIGNGYQVDCYVGLVLVLVVTLVVTLVVRVVTLVETRVNLIAHELLKNAGTQGQHLP